MKLSDSDLNLLKHNPGGIYALSIVGDARVYIGQSGSTKGIRRRIHDHRSYLKRGKHKNPRLQNAWNKYGGDDFFEAYVVEVCEDAELDEREIHWIRLFHATGAHGGFNICEGGSGEEGNPMKHPEARAKVSAAMIGKRPSDAAKARMSAAKTGENHPNFGKKPSEETRAAISAAQIGERNHFFGKKHSEETRAAISAALSGDNNPMRNPEVVAKASATRRANKEKRRRNEIFANLADLSAYAA
jgi:group I intron endonuclease